MIKKLVTVATLALGLSACGDRGAFNSSYAVVTLQNNGCFIGSSTIRVDLKQTKDANGNWTCTISRVPDTNK